MSKQVKLKKEARDALMRGINLVGNAVSATIGPRGRNAVIGRTYGPPKITNDGVTIAKEIEVADPFESAGAAIMKDVAESTNAEAGDGTSTAAVLMQALANEGMLHLEQGVNVMSMRRGMERAGAEVIAELKAMAKPVEDDEIVRVAAISAESLELGEIIADTIKKVGKNGAVTVEESHLSNVTAEIVEGMELKNGYSSPAMCTDFDKMIADYRDIDILVTDKKLSYLPDIMPFWNAMTEAGKKALVIIGDVEGEVLKTVLFNKLRGGFAVLAIKPPGFGDDKKEILQDIAVTVGAKFVSDDTGIDLKGADLSVLGKAHRVMSKEKSTVIAGGSGKKEDREARIALLQERMNEMEDNFSKEKIRDRIGKLSGGAAIIRVGAATEGDMTYLKDKIEDAVNATKAAIEEGIVPGGGSALVKIAHKLNREAPRKWWKPAPIITAEQAGYDIVIRALSQPLRRIAENAGRNGDEVVKEVEFGGPNYGFDAENNRYIQNMWYAGIVDPVKVTRTAVKRAVSASAILITTEVAIVDAVHDLLK